MSDKLPSFSVIIPTLNEEENIGELILSCLKQIPSPKEIIVVDANSDDKTVQIVKSLRSKKVRCISSSPPVGSQRTLGGNLATGEYLFFLDADVHVPRNFFYNSLQSMKVRTLDISCPEYRPYQSTLPIKVVYFVFNLVFKLTESWLASGAGSSIIVKKDVFIAVQGFRANHTYDDIEFVRRVSKKYRFGTLSTPIYVSDRRFKKYGVLFVTAQYLFLSLFFLLGLFSLANLIPYSFGNYKKKDQYAR